MVKKKIKINNKLKMLSCQIRFGHSVELIDDSDIFGYTVAQCPVNPFLFSCTGCGEWAAWIGFAGMPKRYEQQSNFGAWVARINALTPERLEEYKRLAPIDAMLNPEQRKLSFHHLFPQSEFPIFAEDPRNVFPLCNKCHSGIERANGLSFQFARGHRR